MRSLALRIGLRAADLIVRSLPARVAYGMADLGGRAWYRRDAKRRGRVTEGLRRVQSALGRPADGPALRRLVERSFIEYARYYVELLRAPHYRPEDARRHVTVDNWESQGAVVRAGAVVALPHLGNFDPFGHFVEAEGITGVAPVEETEPPELYDFVHARRAAGHGMRVVPLSRARRPMIEALRGGEIAALVADRDLAGDGIEVTMFGHPVTLPAGPAWLAVTTERPLVIAALPADRSRPLHGPPLAPRHRRSRRRIAPPADRSHHRRDGAHVRGGDRRGARAMVRHLPALLDRSTRMSRPSVSPARGAGHERRPRGGGTRGKADMHLHTLWSDGTAAVAELLDWVQEATDLDVIAITDHERIDGAQRALDLHARGSYGFDLVVGEEITTRRGHLLALFLTDRVRALRPLDESLAAVHAQGGLAIAAHPLAPLTPSLGAGSLRAAHEASDPARRLDGIELLTRQRGRPRRDARRAPPERRAAPALPAVGYSDAHVLEGIGTAWTWFRRRRPPPEYRAALVGRHDRARRDASGRTGTTSTSTAASSSPRDGTLRILSVPQESGDDRSSKRRPPATRLGCPGPAGRAEGRHREPVRLPAPGRRERPRPQPVRAAHAPSATTPGSSPASTARSGRARATSSDSGPAGPFRPTAASAA